MCIFYDQGFHVEVSILVLVDVGLRQTDISHAVPFDEVSILVLVDVGLRQK